MNLFRCRYLFKSGVDELKKVVSSVNWDMLEEMSDSEDEDDEDEYYGYDYWDGGYDDYDSDDDLYFYQQLVILHKLIIGMNAGHVLKMQACSPTMAADNQISLFSSRLLLPLAPAVPWLIVPLNPQSSHESPGTYKICIGT